jgi:hypothetical protein
MVIALEVTLVVTTFVCTGGATDSEVPVCAFTTDIKHSADKLVNNNFILIF